MVKSLTPTCATATRTLSDFDVAATTQRHLYFVLEGVFGRDFIGGLVVYTVAWYYSTLLVVSLTSSYDSSPEPAPPAASDVRFMRDADDVPDRPIGPPPPRLKHE